MTYYIESYKPIGSVARRERLVVKSFGTVDRLHRFLNTGDNALRWRESTKGLNAGTYAFAGGKWHNVKHLDAVLLAHI